MEKELSQETIEARQKLIDEGQDEGAIDAYIALNIGDDDLSDFVEAYQGEYKDDEDFAMTIAEETTTALKEQSWPFTCIDWEHAARELMGDYSEQDGYYFRNL